MAETLTEKKAALRRWVPRKWKPEYEIVVAYSSAGFGNQKIADLMREKHNLSYTKQHISNILNTPQAEEFRERLLEKMRKNNIDNIPQQLEDIRKQAIKNIKSVLANPDLMESSPLAVFDRSLQVAKGLGDLKEDKPSSGNMNINNAVFAMPAELAQIFTDGLNKANEVKLLHGGDPK